MNSLYNHLIILSNKLLIHQRHMQMTYFCIILPYLLSVKYYFKIYIDPSLQAYKLLLNFLEALLIYRKNCVKDFYKTRVLGMAYGYYYFAPYILDDFSYFNLVFIVKT